MNYQEEKQLTKKERRKIYFYFIFHFLFNRAIHHGFCLALKRYYLNIKKYSYLSNQDIYYLFNQLNELMTFRPKWATNEDYWFGHNPYKLDKTRLKIAFKCWLLTFK